MILEAAFAAVITLGAGDAAPEYVAAPNSTHLVAVAAEASPVKIKVVSILPSRHVVRVMNCYSSPTCSVNVTFPQCGLYQFPGVIEYAHLAPGDAGPYVIGVNAAVIVTGCDLFSDGFETGTTDAWSRTQGG